MERSPFWSVQFQGNTGWILGPASYMSSDNGNTWQKMFVWKEADDYVPGAVQHAYCLMDEHIGFGVSERGFLLMSSDRGASWRIVDDKSTTKNPVFMIEPHGLGFAARDEGTCRTTDGGRSWEVMPQFGYLHFTDVAHSNDGTIYAHWRYSLLKSSDRGVSWIEVKAIRKAIGLSLIGDTLWIVGAYGMCVAYDTKTEEARTFPLPAGVALIDIAGYGNTLITVGTGGSLFVSVGTPPAWRRVDLGTTDTLEGVAFSSDGAAFVVGGRIAGSFGSPPPRRIALKSRDYEHWEQVRLP